MNNSRNNLTPSAEKDRAPVDQEQRDQDFVLALESILRAELGELPTGGTSVPVPSASTYVPAKHAVPAPASAPAFATPAARGNSDTQGQTARESVGAVNVREVDRMLEQLVSESEAGKIPVASDARPAPAAPGAPLSTPQPARTTENGLRISGLRRGADSSPLQPPASDLWGATAAFRPISNRQPPDTTDGISADVAPRQSSPIPARSSGSAEDAKAVSSDDAVTGTAPPLTAIPDSGPEDRRGKERKKEKRSLFRRARSAAPRGEEENRDASAAVSVPSEEDAPLRQAPAGHASGPQSPDRDGKPPVWEEEPDTELQWSDDKLFAAIDSILSHSIFDEPHETSAEALLSEIPAMPVASPAQADMIPTEGSAPVILPDQAEAPAGEEALPAPATETFAVPAEVGSEGLPSDDHASSEPPAQPADVSAKADVTGADVPSASSSATEVVSEPSPVDSASIPEQKLESVPEPASETSREAAPAGETVRQKEKPSRSGKVRKRFSSWLSDLMQASEEDDWAETAPQPVTTVSLPESPAESELKMTEQTATAPTEASSVPEQVAGKGPEEFPDHKKREPGSAMSLEDLLAAAIPMEEAAPVVRPTKPSATPVPARRAEKGIEEKAAQRQKPSEKAAARQKQSGDNAPVQKPAAPAEPAVKLPPVPGSSPAQKSPTTEKTADRTAPVRKADAAPSKARRPETAADPKIGPEPAAFLTRHAPKADNRPRPKAPHAWLADEVSIPARVPDSISTVPEDTAGLSPAAPEDTPPAKDAPSKTSRPFAHPETGLDWEGPDILTDPVPSAAVRPAPKRPPEASNSTARRAEAERDSIREEDVPAEKPAILHPEEAYRKYTKPIGSIGSAIVVTGFFGAIALFLTLYLSLGWKFLPEIFSGGFSAYLQLVLLIAMVITNHSLYAEAVRGLGKGKFSLDTLIVFATFFTAMDTFGAAKALRAPFGVVICALLMLSLWGKYQQGMAMAVTTKVLKEKDISTGVVEVQDITKGRCGITRTKPDIDAFMEKLDTQDALSKAMRVYALAAAIFALIATVFVSVGLKQDFFMSGALIFIGSIPLSGMVAYGRLFFLLSMRLSEAKAALCGYYGAEVFGGDHSILIGDDDLFPEGSLALNGFKVYQGNPERIIAYATAATRRSGSALFPLFDELLDTHNGRHYVVDSFRFYDSGGIGATIVGDVVLLGSLDFMRRMGIHMDGGTKVRQAVYVSVNGELAAVFAVKYTPPESIRKGLAAIAGNRHFKGILVTRTFLGTPSFLKARFGVPTGALTYPPTKERLRLSEEKMKSSGNQGAVLVKNSFVGFAQAAAGGRVLRSATALATVLSVVGGILSLLLMTVLAALSDHSTATAVNLLFYVLAWLIPTMLLSSWTRHY